MAPSIIDEPKADVVVPVKAPTEASITSTEKPKIRRIIDEEGGTTTASVSISYLTPLWPYLMTNVV